jgi:hypothetical protein
MSSTLIDDSVTDHRIDTIWAALSLDEETGCEGILAGARVSEGPDGLPMHIWHPLLTSDPHVLKEMKRMAANICGHSKDKTFHIVRFERVTEQ